MDFLPLHPYCGRWRASGQTKHRCATVEAGAALTRTFRSRSIGATAGGEHWRRNEPVPLVPSPATEFRGAPPRARCPDLPKRANLGGRRPSVVPHFLPTPRHERDCFGTSHSIPRFRRTGGYGGPGVNARLSFDRNALRQPPRFAAPPQHVIRRVRSANFISTNERRCLPATGAQKIHLNDLALHADENCMEGIQTCRTIRTKKLNR
jgi:hypothetical protein